MRSLQAILLSKVKSLALAPIGQAMRVLFFLTAGFFSLAAPAAEKCKFTFRAGLLFQEPLYYLENGRNLKGYSLDVINELRRRTGCQFNVEQFNRPNLIERFRTRQVDLAIPQVKTAAFDAVAEFVPLYLQRRGLTFHPDIKPQPKNLDEAFANKKILFGNLIATQLYYTQAEIDFLRKNNRLVEFTDYESLFLALSRGKIQAVVGASLQASYFLQKFKMKNVKIKPDRAVMTQIGYYIAPSRLKKEQRTILLEATRAMEQDGAFVEIYSRYADPEIVKFTVLPLDTP